MLTGYNATISIRVEFIGGPIDGHREFVRIGEREAFVAHWNFGRFMLGRYVVRDGKAFWEGWKHCISVGEVTK